MKNNAAGPDREPLCQTLPNGTREWRVNGRLHRTDGPAVERANGTREWYVDGRLHRTDGPAVESANGTREWRVNGRLHRTDGPAVEWVDGNREWRVNGQLHRTDGPAVERPNGSREWWVDGQQMTEQEFDLYRFRRWAVEGILTQPTNQTNQPQVTHLGFSLS